jgi:hypothetical protein
MRSCQIITAASDAFGPSLLALLGSLNLNWPGHPPVLVYDIGLDAGTLERLDRYGIPVRKVPPFCVHWRQHYTWKLWCLNDAPAQNILWMDSAMMVLQPLDEILEAIDKLGYFFTTNYELLDWEASDEACAGCGVPPNFRNGKPTLPATLMGFKKTGLVLEILREALDVALVEKNIAATEVTHRHDQALLSLLVYKHLKHVVIADGNFYLGSMYGSASPEQVPGQKIWAHRRKLGKKDAEHLASHVTGPGDAHTPSPPVPLRVAKALALLYKVHWYFGKGDLVQARDNLETAYAIAPMLKNEPNVLASSIYRHSEKMKTLPDNKNHDGGFADWVLKQAGAINGERFAKTVASLLHQRKHHSADKKI